ncbi:MAG: YdcF family protein [Lachnospiraceae bacterium]|nr:YdcF family protein [Lachnospiraceae bacterium]
MKKLLLQIALIVIGVLGLIWFLTPFAVGRIMNLGNGTGAVIMALIMAYGVFMPKINQAIVKLHTIKIGKIILTGILIIVGAVILLAGVETAFMIKAATAKPSEDATVVVLGCRAYGSRPSIMLASRLDAAYEYLTEHSDAICIVSGGQGPDESMSEAECMYLYLTEKGIAPERIYMEDKSTSTRENLLFSQEIIEAEGLNPEIAIVTNEYHEYRAGMVADALEMEYSAVPARTPLWLFPTYYIRELYGIIYEWVL